MALLDGNSRRATKVAMAGLLVALVAAVGCDSRYSPWFDHSDRFADDDDDDDWWDDPCGGMGASSTSSGFGPSGDPELSDDAARAIAEADIVKVVDQRLYALSRTAGLSVVDVSGSGLSLIGQRDLSGTPAEMYVVDGRVYAMSDDATSHYTIVSVVDVSEASNITMVGSQHLEGHLSDSRLVGDVLYLVT
ncbi:MAG: beta-propeller domain-containing protein, partial [Deltaproteobacteria bacterium]|nr:beta-propeller domain-containing protein [Deltaproteobacteria bacterium]